MQLTHTKVLYKHIIKGRWRKIFHCSNSNAPTFNTKNQFVIYIRKVEKRRIWFVERLREEKAFVEGDGVNVLMGNQFIHFTPFTLLSANGIVVWKHNFLRWITWNISMDFKSQFEVARNDKLVYVCCYFSIFDLTLNWIARGYFSTFWGFQAYILLTAVQ